MEILSFLILAGAALIAFLAAFMAERVLYRIPAVKRFLDTLEGE